MMPSKRRGQNRVQDNFMDVPNFAGRLGDEKFDPASAFATCVVLVVASDESDGSFYSFLSQRRTRSRREKEVATGVTYVTLLKFSQCASGLLP
jgi:hypothetical protein